MKIKLFPKGEIKYGWCLLPSGGSHYRQLVGTRSDGKDICRDCFRIFMQEQATRISTQKPEKKKKRGTTKKQQQTLKTRIFEYLSTGVYTQTQIYENVKHNRKPEQIKRMLWKLRRNNEILTARKDPRGETYYTTLGNIHLVREALGVGVIEEIPQILAEESPLSVSAIALKLSRSQNTTSSWIARLEKEGILETWLVKAEKRGHYRLCKLKERQESRDF